MGITWLKKKELLLNLAEADLESYPLGYSIQLMLIKTVKMVLHLNIFA